MFKKDIRKQKRKNKIRVRITGSAKIPRLAVNRSNRHIYVQAIDDINKTTLASSTDLKILSGNKIEKATSIGNEIAGKLLKKNITKAVFDRAGYKYHGRIKAIAEGARKAGLNF